MAMMKKTGKPRTSALPSTVARSGKKAQRTFAKAHDSAAERYGEGRHAMQIAYAALKFTHEKVGDHWEKKDHPGPSDDQVKGDTRTAMPTAGGVDVNASKKHLYELAKRLDVPGRSTMSKSELVSAIQMANQRATAEA